MEHLGRLLFWDPLLFGSRDVACATCHHPDFAYADGRDLSLGVGAIGLGPTRVDMSGGRIPTVKRNAQTILNTRFNRMGGRRRRRGFGAGATAVDPTTAPMFWDSRVRGLEAQAIAAFERSLVAMDSPFDRFRAGDTQALTPQQRRGFDTFDEVGCDRCHRGTMLSDFDLESEGVAEHPGLSTPDAGDGRFRFRTPSLRNVALTAPYMHNGTLATLEDVLRFYDNGRSENPNVSNGRGQNGDRTPRLSGSFRRVDNMSEREMQDITAFLMSLSDTNFDRTIPASVPSRLPPGGFIQSHENR